MPYSQILGRLLNDIDGAVGVGFADYEGETVQLLGRTEDYLHRLQLAYQGITLHNLQEMHNSSLSQLTLVYKNRTLVIKPLKGGYYLVLTLEHRRQLYKAFRLLEESAEALNKEL